MSGIIEVENLSFGYYDKTILKNLSFKVTEGSFLTIAGPNGAGKTTLLNLLCGLLRPQNGSISIDGADVKSYAVRELAQKVAVVRQEFVPVFDFTVAEVVSMARTPYLGILGFEGPADKRHISEALEMTDTSRFASRPLAHLSAGERQRVFIARALAQDTSILLLDEPTTFLDLKHQVGIYDLLKRMQQEYSRTIVAVTHDINLAIQYCNETLLLGGDDKYRYGSATDIFTSQQIEETFGVKTFEGVIGKQRFFLPVGKFAKANQITNGKS